MPDRIYPGEFCLYVVSPKKMLCMYAPRGCLSSQLRTQWRTGVCISITSVSLLIHKAKKRPSRTGPFFVGRHPHIREFSCILR